MHTADTFSPKSPRNLLAVAATFAALVTANQAQAGQYPFTQEDSLDSDDIAQSGIPTLADLDNDGDQDLVLRGYDSFWWYENDGGFDQPMQERPIDPTLGDASDVEPADIDEDGDLELVTTSSLGLVIYENVQNAGVFKKHVLHELGDALVEVGDVDGDGDLDVIHGDTYDDELRWFANPGTLEGEWVAKNVPLSIYEIESMLAADIDGDGRSEVLLANEGSFVVMHYDDGPWSEEALDPGTGIVELRADDIDDDGDIDILVGEQLRAVIMRNVGDGLLASEELENSGNLIVDYRLAMGDVDADGARDLILVSSVQGGAIRWLPNEGGEFGAPQVIHESLTHSAGMDVADVDCDGDADVVSHGAESAAAWRIAMFTNETVEATGDECVAGGGDDGGDDSADDDGGDADPDGGSDDGGDGAGDDAADDDDGGDESGGGDETGGGDGAATDEDEDGAGGLCSVDRSGGAPVAALGLMLLALGYRRRR